MSNTIIYILTFILGTIFGSFSSVITSRYIESIQKNSPEKAKSILTGRSECPHCHTRLKTKNLIPIISYIFQKGKCNQCSTKISIFYPALEILTGLIFTLALYLSTFPNGTINYLQFILTSIIFFLAINISLIDLKTQRIPTKLSILLGISTLIYSLSLHSPSLQQLFISASIGYFFFYAQHFYSKGKWVGLGDADLGLCIGLLFSPSQTLFTILQSYILGTLIIIPLFHLKKDNFNRNSQIPFGPFLMVSLILSLSFGKIILDWYLNTFIYIT